MAISWGFFADPALTTPVLGSLSFVQNVAAPTAQDAVVYFGSPIAGRRLRDAAMPLSAQLTLIVADANVPGGSPAADVKLATSAAGLATAVGGAPLSLGTSLLSGLDAVVAVHIRVLDSTHVVGRRDDLSVVLSAAEEVLA